VEIDLGLGRVWLAIDSISRQTSAGQIFKCEQATAKKLCHQLPNLCPGRRCWLGEASAEKRLAPRVFSRIEFLDIRGLSMSYDEWLKQKGTA